MKKFTQTRGLVKKKTDKVTIQQWQSFLGIFSPCWAGPPHRGSVNQDRWPRTSQGQGARGFSCLLAGHSCSSPTSAWQRGQTPGKSQEKSRMGSDANISGQEECPLTRGKVSYSFFNKPAGFSHRESPQQASCMSWRALEGAAPLKWSWLSSAVFHRFISEKLGY